MQNSRIGLVDYGSGNLRSVVRAIEEIGGTVLLVQDSESSNLNSCSHLIVPGVGSFGDAMQKLNESGIANLIRQWILQNRPYLGICLGYQILFESSEESPSIPGLNILEGTVTRFLKHDGIKVPHIGWNSIRIIKDEFLLKGINDGSEFYFVHSYYPVPKNKSIITTLSDYGVSFASSIATNNLCGVQFHPEKSQKLGLQILKNFIS